MGVTVYRSMKATQRRGYNNSKKAKKKKNMKKKRNTNCSELHLPELFMHKKTPAQFRLICFQMGNQFKYYVKNMKFWHCPLNSITSQNRSIFKSCSCKQYIQWK